MTPRAITKLLSPIRRRLALLVTRGVVSLVNDGLKMQEVQVTGHAGEVLDKVERWQNYGFTSRPIKGAEALLLAIGGHRSHTAAVAVDDRRHRPKDLKEGEVCLYTDEGDRITFKRGKIIEVIAGSKLDVTAPEVNVVASTSVTFDTPKVIATQDFQIDRDLLVKRDIKANGEVEDHTSTMQEMRDIYNAHTHNGAVPVPGTLME